GWQWWTTFEKDASSGNEERFALIRYILNNQQTDGVYRPTKLLYALGNFSRFIRPGMKRVDVMRSDDLSAADAIANQMVSAYIDEINQELVIVVINASTQSRSIRMNISGLSNNMGITHFTPYITTNSLNDALRRGSDIAVTENYTMPATSIVTFVGKIRDLSDTGIIESVSDSRISVYPNPAKDQVTIRSEVPVNKISLIDLNGKIIYSSNPDSEIAVLPLNGLYKGVYVLKLNTGEETEIQKLIVK
ncbi:MAG TPA: Por secretion system protein, partial [Coprobacter fastidiosus]|nr:Por secretion system protein [Coprobacter fastidiosus]